MAEIICIECKSHVSDASGYCPNCGYPFDIAPAGQNSIVVADVNLPPQHTDSAPPLDMISQSLASVRVEMSELQRTVTDLKQDFNVHLMPSTDNFQKILTEIVQKLDAIASVTRKADAQTDPPEKTKNKLLTTFYKTLNSPNSMFEYMFYICVVQIVFVIVTLFLVAYIVTLVRR